MLCLILMLKNNCGCMFLDYILNTQCHLQGLNLSLKTSKPYCGLIVVLQSQIQLCCTIVYSESEGFFGKVVITRMPSFLCFLAT